MRLLQNIGNKIREQRKCQNMLISELASRTGLSISHISNIEKGKYYFSIESLIYISNALNISINYLLLDTTKSDLDLIHDFQQILNDCDQNEICILLDNAKSLKETLRRNKNYS